MVYNQFQAPDNSDYEREETWDLRQFYTRFVGLYMLDYKSAQDNSDYPKMLSVLDRWHSVVHGRISKKLSNDGKVAKDGDYDSLRKELITLAIKYKSAWLKSSRDPKAIGEIEEAFHELVAYIIYKMKKNELFGKMRDISGL